MNEDPPPRRVLAAKENQEHQDPSKLTLEQAAVAFARFLNTLEPAHVENLLAPDCCFRSQLVFEELQGSERVLAHLKMKCRVIRSTNYPTFGELATCPSFGGQPCVVIAQGTRNDLQGVALFKTGPEGITDIDLCVLPTPQSCVRSGEYPGISADGLQ